MNFIPAAIVALRLPILIDILVFIDMYKRFVKKVNITAFYTPFDEIMGQTEVKFHEEQQYVYKEDEEQGDDKDKNKKLFK
ncbi:DUF3951 domain-containing protein [Pseudalkalibacillus berkeleyi]|uniref:DUF3951 domain-containing protein n=1 Tax=Pseudalkalibacillus berkeleyi TaxID=1069813 RepID=A0ABS9GV72_9BACL|nr:DUF3951 domain-containing protein [Pseudalkalibacillus berkeleyi]MCF6136584.1 DUF3951 domain-containing protein [Pseudalkalibacillus berkeleyi]